MPSTYTASSSGITPHEAVSVAVPIGADAPNASSVTTPLETLANTLQYLMEHALLADGIETAELNGDATNPSDLSAAITTDACQNVNMRKLLWEIATGTVEYPAQNLRLYSLKGSYKGTIELTVNAKWNGSTWQHDGTNSALRLALAENSVVVSFRNQPSNWADSAWDGAYTLTRNVSAHCFGRSELLMFRAYYQDPNVERYLVPSPAALMAEAEESGSESGHVVTSNGTLRNLHCEAATLTDGAVLYVRINGADTALRATLASAGSYEDSTHTASVNAGDVVSVRCTTGAGGIASRNIFARVQFDPA